MTALEAWEFLITDGLLHGSIDPFTPGSVVAHAPKKVREALASLTSDELNRMRVDYI